MSKIEIAMEVEILAGIAFWIERAEWAAMSDEAKSALIAAKIDDIAAILTNDRLHFAAADLSAEITGPDIIPLNEIRIYDPQEG